MRHLLTLMSNTRPLADVFLDTLRRSASASNPQFSRQQDTDRDRADQLILQLEDEETAGGQPDAVGTMLPDQALAAVLLGRALDCNMETLATVAQGGVVVIEAPYSELVAPVATIVHRCLIDRAWAVKDGAALAPADASVAAKTIVLFKRDGTDSSHNADSGNAKVGIGLQMRCPIVGIAADAGQTLPSDLMRVADKFLVLPPVDVEAIAAVITAVTGVSPTTIGPHLADRTTLADLMLAIRADRGPDECVRRLERLTARSDAQADSGPTLFELQGLGKAKDFAIELLEDLQDFKAGRIPAGSLPRGVILSSPPGCGKTALARALSKTAGVHFISTSYSAWQSLKGGHLGDVTRAIRNVFAEARSNAPAIVFIDEIDSVPTRGSDEHYDNWWTSIVNTLLEQLDGFESREGVVVIAACNDPRKIDPALLRSGRLDKHIRIDLPDPIALAGILRTHLGRDLEGVDLRPAAATASGATGADAERWVRGARRRARKARRAVKLEDLLAEIREGRQDFPEDVRRRVAYHEAGHAICAMVLGIGEPQSLAVSVAGGTILVEPGAMRAQTAADFKNRIAYILAGRAAEDLVCSDVCAGSGGGEQSDLALGTNLAVVMESAYGLGAQGPVWYGAGHDADLLRFPEIRAAARRTLEQAQAYARQLLQAHRPSLDRLADALFLKGFLDRDDIRAAVHPLLTASAADKLTSDVPVVNAPRL